MSNNVLRKLLVFAAFILFLAIFSESASAAITACGLVSTSDSLTQNISSADSCLIVNANNVNINCNGFSITFNTGVGAGTSFGVYAPGFNNITVRNCQLIDANGSSTLKSGIYFDSVNSSNITNNTIITRGRGTVSSIRIRGSNSTVQDNTLSAITFSVIEGNFSNGIILTQGSGFTVLRNTIFVSGAGGPSLIMANSTSGCYIDQNTINNTAAGNSIDLRDATSCTVSNNTINSSGGSNGISSQVVSTGNSFVNITRNSVTVYDSGVSAILAFPTSSVNISFNNVTVLNGSNADGIRTGSNGTFVYRNSILFDGVNSGGAIPLEIGSTFSSAIDNNITYQNVSSCVQLGVISMPNVNHVLVQGNNVTIRCSTASRIAGIHLSANNNVTFINNRVNISNSDVNWFRVVASTTNTSFTNTTFSNRNGEALFFNFGNATLSYVNMTFFNFSNSTISINTTNLTYLNTSAQITLFNPVSAMSPPKLGVDFEDDGTFTPCADNICRVLSSSSTALTFNVTRFTSFSSSSIFPAVVNESSNVTSNITVNGSAFIINASNIVFDCQGFTITGNGTGGGPGINVTSQTNVTIRNCIIINFTNNILFNGTNNSAITNVTVYNATAEAIEIRNSANNILSSITGESNGLAVIDITSGRNNTLRNSILTNTDASEALSVDLGTENNTIQNITARSVTDGAIVLFTNASNNTFTNINAFSNASTLGVFFFSSSSGNTIDNSVITGGNLGVQLSSSNSNTIKNTNVTINQTTNTRGILISSSTNNLLTNLTVNQTLSSGLYAIQVAGQHNIISNVNAITASSAGNASIEIFANNNTIINSNLSAPSGPALLIIGGSNSRFTNIIANASSSSNGTTILLSTNNTFVNLTSIGGRAVSLLNISTSTFNHTTLVSSNIWISSGPSLILSGNFTNTTFYTLNGTILINGSFGINASQSVNTTSINVTFNRSFINSSSVPYLNQSAKITLHNVNVNTTGVDFNDDGTYEACNATQCQLESFNGSTIVFNVSSFTSYAAVNFSSNSPPVVANVTLTATTSQNSTDDNLTVAFNVTDADGDSTTNTTDWRINSTSMAVLNMPFEAGTSNSSFTDDFSTYENNGNVTGATFNNSGGYNGFGAYQFDGNDYISVADNVSLQFPYGQFTLSAWVNPSSLPAIAGIIGKDDGVGNDVYQLRLDSGVLTGFVRDGANIASVPSGATLSTNQWTFVALVQNSTAVQLYVNGTVSGSAVSVSGTGNISPTNTLFIGDLLSPSSFPFSGVIDDVRIYNRSLSPQQLLAIYNNRTDLIVSQETQTGEVWQSCVTPNDMTQNGSTVCSNNLTINAPGAACPGSITVDTNLTSDVSSATGCVTFSASGITLDCNGYTMTWDTGGTGSDGISANSVNNITIKNCVMNDGNSGGNDGYGITFSAVTNSFIINNTIQTNGTDTNYGIRLASSSNSNLIANNTIRSNGSGNENTGIYLETSSSNLIFNNTILPYGGGSNPHGIEFSTSSNNNITQNNITKLVNVGNAIRFGGTSQRNRIVGNFIDMTSDGQNTIEMNNNYQNTTIADNLIYNGGFRGILSNANGENLNVTNNTIFLRQSTVIVGILINTQGSVANDNKIYINTSNDAYGIRSTAVSSGSIQNNYISFNATTAGWGISLEDTTNSIISGNNVSINSTATDNRGIRTQGTTTGNNITNNFLNVNGSGTNYGIIFTANTHNNLVENNNIRVQTGSQNEGIHSNTGSSNRFFNNNITVFGSLNNRGIRFFNNANNNTANNNYINVNGTTSYGVFVDGTSNIFNNNTLNDTTEWLQTSTGAQGNFTNTTFQTNNGSIFISGLVQLNDVKLVTRNVLNISLNSAYVNSTNMSALNQSAQILLRNIPPTNPSPIVDFEDDGTFVACNSPQCVVINSSNITFVMNVSSFTNYSTEDAAACPGNITSSTTLTGNVSSSGNCVTFNANDIFFDCNGYTVTWDTAGTGSDAVVAAGRMNVTTRNCVLVDGNSSGSNGIGVRYTTSINSFIYNNTIRTNGTDQNYGVELTTSNTSFVYNNTIFTFGSSSNNHGIILGGNSLNNNIENNTISTFGTTDNRGIQLGTTSGSDNNNITSNTISTNGTGVQNFGIYLEQADNNLIRHNTVNTSGTTDNYGIEFSNSLNNTAFNNTVLARGSANNYGIIIISSSDSTVINNTIRTNGTSGNNHGAYLPVANRNNLTGNLIAPFGVSSNRGVYVSTGSNNTISDNIIAANGTGSGNEGVRIETGTLNTVNSNSIATRGTADNYGVSIITSSFNNIVTNNNINTANTSLTSNFGINSVSSHNTTFINNSVSTGGSSTSHGIRLFISINNTFNRTTLATAVPSSFGISMTTSNSTFDNTLFNFTTNWIDSVSDTNLNNFTNTTFATPNGSVRVYNNFTVSGIQTILQTRLNITNNLAFLNSTNLSFLNTTAQITLVNVSPSNPQPIVDFEDDGTFVACNSPQCVVINNSNLTFIMNVSSFTSYSTEDTATCPGIITTDTNLTEDITAMLNSQQSCVQFGANSITLDCQGFTMTGNGSGLGVNATSRSNITVRNCNIVNFTNNILWTGVASSFINNVNASNSTGIVISLASSSSHNQLSNITVQGITVSNHFSTSTATNNTYSNIIVRGNGTGDFFSLAGVTNSFVNNLTVTGNASSGNMLNIQSTSTGNTFSNIFINSANKVAINIIAGTNNNHFRNITIENATAASSSWNFQTGTGSIDNLTLTGTVGNGLNILGGVQVNVSNAFINKTGSGNAIGGSGGAFSVFENITAITGSGDGINLGVSNHILRNVTGMSTSGNGLQVDDDNNVVINSYFESGSTAAMAIGGGALNNSLTNITAIGSIGITLSGSTNVLQNIQSNGTGLGQNSITITGSNNNLRNVTSRSSSGSGIAVNGASGNNISEFTIIDGFVSPLIIQSGAANTSATNGTIRSASSCVNCDGIALTTSTNTILDNITIVSPTSSLFDWISTSAATSNASIRNITFETGNGSIKTIQNVTLPGPLNLNRDRLNISPNRAFLNSSNASFLNTTAQITLTNVNSSVLLVDFEDDGTFALCSPPQCVLQSFSGGTVVFNVSSFTSYSTSDFGGVNVTLSKSDSPDPINLSNTTILTYQINFTVTNGTAFNLTINETYPDNTTFINSSPIASSGNDGWNVGNLTAGQTYQINITINVSTTLANGTSLINTISATYENSTGSQFNLSVSEATIVINEIVVQTNATLTKTDSPDPLNISNSTLLTFQVNFTVNNGTAYNTTIIETYSGNVTFVNATPAPTTGNNNWSVGNITAPGVYQINITVNVSNSLSNGSIVTNTVNATYENATGSSFNIDATTVTTILVDAAPANATVVSLTKTDSPDPLNISSTTLLTYQINFTVTNGTAINTTINETYPSNATFVNATPTPTTGNNSWSAGNISAGTTYQINITLNVSSALSNGTILTNTVNTTYSNATGSALTANVQQNTTVIRNLEFNATVITMTKIDAPDPVIAGQNLIYTITINVTNGTAFNTTLTDSYPSQVSFVSATPAANSSNNTWIVGNLTAGQSFQVNITVNVNSSTANGTTINNTANISYANQTGSILTLNATAQTTVSTQSFPIVINNNTNITTNGSTTGPGIIINSSNVTVNCNGNIITGSGSSVGVNITGFNNVTIQNCVFVNFATGAHVENSNINQFTSNTFRTVTSGVNLLGTSQNSAFNHTIIAASSDWVFTSAASSGNIFQNTSYNDTGGQIIITPSVTFAANTNASQSRLDITSPDAFLNSTALPFLDAASRVTITGITNTNTALILGDFDDDGTYEICSAPTCTLVSFASGTAIFDTSGWTSYTVVDGGVNFTLTKTSSPDPVTPGNNVVFTITATVNSGFAQNITVVESPPAELTFVTSTPTNISDNTWLLNNLSAGQSAQINVTYAVNSSFSGTIQNNVSVTFQNSTNGTVTTNVSQNTTAQTPSPSGGSGGGGGGGSSAAICPPFCQYPENKDLPVCRNNCPPAQAPAQQDFGSMFPPVSDSVPPVEEPIVEEPAKEETVVEETPVEESKPVKSKFFPWWYVLIAIVAIVFMIWETHHIVSKIHKPSKEQSKLDKIDKDIARMRKMLKK